MRVLPSRGCVGGEAYGGWGERGEEMTQEQRQTLLDAAARLDASGWRGLAEKVREIAREGCTPEDDAV